MGDDNPLSVLLRRRAAIQELRGDAQGPVQRKSEPLPAWKQRAQTIFDHGIDMVTGALGIPTGQQETKGSLLGQLLSAGMPMVGGLKALKGAAKAPIKAYHGSPHDFERFDISKAGSTTDRGLMGRGLYFSTDPNVAATRPRRYEVDLALQNPLEVSMPSWGGNKQKIVAEQLGLPPNSTAEDITAAAKAKGYDSVAMDYSPVGYDKKEFAVFDDKLINIVKKYGIAGALAAGLINETQARQMKEQGIK
jgi:hypothetical protein